MSRPETITEEIAHAIIAALGSSENPVEQMLEMVKLLDQAGYKIVRKDDIAKGKSSSHLDRGVLPPRVALQVPGEVHGLARSGIGQKRDTV